MRWLLDEMLPAITATELVGLGHDAVSAGDAGLRGADDIEVMEFAVKQNRILVTENSADFAHLLELRLSDGEPCVPVVFVRKAAFPTGEGLARHLATHLARWAEDNPHPYIGYHWP